MNNVFSCPEDEWASYNDEQKKLWLEMFKAFQISDFLPDGIHMGKGHAKVVARNIAVKVLRTLERVKV